MIIRIIKPTILQNTLLVLLLSVLYPQLGEAQIQPFSRKDSATVINHQQDYELALNAKNYKQAAHYNNKIAFLHWEHNNYSESIKFYEKSIEFNRKIGNENGIAMISNNLGMLHSDVKDYSKALDYFKITLATRRANKEKIGIISALINMSVVQNNLELFSESVAGLEEALSLAREINNIELMRSCYGMLSESHQKAGDNEKSIYYFEYYKTFHELIQEKKVQNVEVALNQKKKENDSIVQEKERLDEDLEFKLVRINDLNQKIIAADTTLTQLGKKLNAKELQLKFIAQEKELLTLQAKREEAKALQEHEDKRNVLIISTLIVLFFAIITALTFLNRKRIREKNKLLTNRNLVIEKINNELEESNAIKDKMFSVIAHDLRGPMGQFQQTMMLFDEDMLSEEEKKFMSKELKSSFKKVNELLNNLLAWSKNQISGEDINMRSLMLNEVVDAGVSVLEDMYTAKEINIEKKYSYSGNIDADEDMVKLIIRNLTSNAIKFTPKKGTITISNERVGDKINISVSDTGVGMNAAQLHSIFDTSSYDSTSGTQNEVGTGLGLKLCKEYVEAMHGTIQVQSEPNLGTQFKVLLPIKS